MRRRESRKAVLVSATDRRLITALEPIAHNQQGAIRHVVDSDGCVQMLEKEPCDVLLLELDGNPRDRLQVLAEVKQMHPFVTSIVVVPDGHVEHAVQAVRAGAVECFERSVHPRTLRAAVEKGLQNAQTDWHSLTPCEMTVLRHMLTGMTNMEIARVLHRSKRTIDAHRRAIMRKLHLSSAIELMNWALDRGYRL